MSANAYAATFFVVDVVLFVLLAALLMHRPAMPTIERPLPVRSIPLAPLPMAPGPAPRRQ